MFRAFLALTTLFLASCMSAPRVQTVPGPVESPTQYGLVAAQAIEVCDPVGEREYLARLICPDGQHPSFDRVGNVGERNPVPDDLSKAEQDRLLQDLLSDRPLQPGEPDYHVVDLYEVRCPASTHKVYVDMYHCNAPRPSKAPEGFTIIK